MLERISNVGVTSRLLAYTTLNEGIVMDYLVAIICSLAPVGCCLALVVQAGVELN